MTAYYSHTLQMNRDEAFHLAPTDSLALVDMESYQAFVGKQADDLDMMVHLHNQMNALTAFAWDVREKSLNLRFVLTGDHQIMERITFANRPPSASGTIRTHGRLCLVSHERLLDCARNSRHDLLRGGHLPKAGRPRILNVPSGIIYVLVYYRFPYPDGNHPGYATQAAARHDYTIFLHHYPHPAPRVAPVRLTGGLIPWAGDDAASRLWGGRGSHKMPEVHRSD